MPNPDPTDDTTELRIQLAEARSEAKLAQALGEIRTEMRSGFAAINARLDSLSGIKATVIGTGIAVVAVIIALMTYGQTWFGIGVSTRDVVKATVMEYRQQTAPQVVPPAGQPQH